jgi:hypothetical protein
MNYRSLKDGDLANPLSLGEFFEGLGGLMRLPPKSGKAPMPARKTRRAGRLLLPALAVGFALALTALKPVLKPERGELPFGLAGHWATIATNYSDRGLEFFPDRIVFQAGPGPGDRTEHLISRVRSRQVGDTTLITLSYLEAGAPFDLSLKYASTPERGLRFTNQDYLVWRPVGHPTR